MPFLYVRLKPRSLSSCLRCLLRFDWLVNSTSAAFEMLRYLANTTNSFNCVKVTICFPLLLFSNTYGSTTRPAE